MLWDIVEIAKNLISILPKVYYSFLEICQGISFMRTLTEPPIPPSQILCPKNKHLAGLRLLMVQVFLMRNFLQFLYTYCDVHLLLTVISNA